MKKTIILVSFSILLVSIVGALLYFQKNKVTDSEPLYPDKLGTYEIFYRGKEKVRQHNKCTDFSKRPHPDAPGLSGEICIENTSVQYREPNTLKVVFVQLGKITKGEDVYNSFLLSQSSLEMLAGVSVRRIENHELGWFPRSEFDVIITQEGTVVPRSDGESMSYGKATGENPVMQYFLKKYPPQN